MSASEGRRGPGHWLILASALVVVGASVFAAALLHPDPRGWGTHEQLGLEPCLPMERWNLPCPGCGVTTAFVHAWQGSFLTALRVQPLGLLGALAAPLFAAWVCVTHARGRDLGTVTTRRGWLRVISWLLVLVVVAWLYKIWSVRSG